MSPLLLPGPAPQSGEWEFAPAAIEEAIALLGIELPVRVRWTAGYRRIGCHRFREGEHRITISHIEGMEQASRTLWHELAHAKQTEEHGRKHLHLFRDRPERRRFLEACASFGRAYRRNRSYFERDAKSYEPFHDDLPLTRPKRTAFRAASFAPAAAKEKSE